MHCSVKSVTLDMQQSGDSKPLYGDDYIQPSINSPFPLELNTLFTNRLSTNRIKIVFYSPSANETHFCKESFAFGLILKVRVVLT